MRKLLTRLKQRTTYLNYGREIVAGWGVDYINTLAQESVRVLDLGCGRMATDLVNIRQRVTRDNVHFYGVEYYEAAIGQIEALGFKVFQVDIEHQEIPVEDGFFDLVIGNQIVEHTKELFWIFSEIARVTRPGGMVIIGVPNLASLHNRILLLFGQQPTSIEILGPHIRGFTIPGFRRFAEAGGYFKPVAVRGSNFYPFPPLLSRPLSRLLPGMSVTSFFQLRRERKQGRFVDIVRERAFETHISG